MDQVFENQEQVDEYVQQILNDPKYQNHDELNQLYQKHITQQKKVQRQILSFVGNNVSKLEQSIDQLNLISNNFEQILENSQQVEDQMHNQQQFYQQFEDFHQLLDIRKNVQTMVDFLKYFQNMSKQIQKYQELQEDQDNLEYIHNKILIINQAKEDIFKNQQTNPSILTQEFIEFDKYFKEFEDNMFYQIKNCKETAKENQKLVQIYIKICQNSDQFLKKQNLKPIYLQKCKDLIIDQIDQTIQQTFKKDINEILDNSSFIVSDLIDIYEYCKDLIPNFDLFSIWKQRYSFKMIQLLNPLIKSENQQFGILMKVMNWVDQWEQLSNGRNIETNEFNQLRVFAQSQMPQFIQHTSQLLSEYCERSVYKDTFENLSLKKIEAKITAKQELISNFPEDIFHFINDQIQLLGPFIKSELFIEFIRETCFRISHIQQDLLQQLNDESQNEQNQELVIFKIVMFMNNYQKCIDYANQTRQFSAKFCKTENQLDRVEFIFINDMNKKFNESIDKLRELIIQFFLVDLQFDQLFSDQHINDTINYQNYLTLSELLFAFKKLFIHESIFLKISRFSIQQFYDEYFKQLILRVKIMSSFNQDYPYDSSIKDTSQYQKYFQNQQFAQLFSKENTMIIDKIKKDFDSIWPPKYFDEIEKKPTLVFQLLETNKYNYQSQFQNLYLFFGQNSKYILQSVLFINKIKDNHLEIINDFENFIKQLQN